MQDPSKWTPPVAIRNIVRTPPPAPAARRQLSVPVDTRSVARRRGAVVRLRQQGLTATEIACQLGVSTRSVERYMLALRRAGVPVGKLTAPCGSWAAYVRHRQKGQAPCDPCQAAHEARSA